MAALCYADKFVTERSDELSEVLIEGWYCEILLMANLWMQF